MLKIANTSVHHEHEPAPFWHFMPCFLGQKKLKFVDRLFYVEIVHNSSILKKRSKIISCVTVRFNLY